MDDIIKKFSNHLKNVLTRALVLAVEMQESSIEPSHLFWALATQDGSVGAEILQKAGLKEEDFHKKVSITVKKTMAPQTSADVPVLSEASKQVIEKAVLTANVYEHRYVGTEHLLCALLETDRKQLTRFLSKTAFDVSAIGKSLTTVFKTTAAFPNTPGPKSLDQLLPGISPVGVEEEDGDGKTPALDYFTDELTHEEATDDIDPLIGRENELNRLMHIISRRNKNNPILVGEPGVGKTAIVEGLAKHIAQETVPDALSDKRIFRLDLAALIAGTMYRGEFESRLRQLVDEISDRPEIILFIDEVHTISGAGSASGSLDAANILKPALARGDIRCIGATTPGEYKKFIETDGALERRFQKIHVAEPNEEQTRNILNGIREHYEEFHNVSYTDEALNAALALSKRYMPEKHFPDKAIDLMDEAAASVRVRQKPRKTSTGVRKLKTDLKKIQAKKHKAVIGEQFSKALACKYKEQELEKKIKQLANKKQRPPTAAVSEADIIRIVAHMTGIPLKALDAPEKARLKNLDKRLKARVLGQDHVIGLVAQAIKRAKLNLHRDTRPLASFLFTGPSGVGKTELAKALAEEVFIDKNTFLRLDMSEYSAQFTVSKLIGSPAGYVGYRENTKLTDFVKQNPYCIILFDELEKAHPDVHALLLQVLEEGEIADATGRPVNFRNAVVAMTSNEGSEFFERGRVGFSSKTEKRQGEKEDVRKQLVERFRRELVNRVDRVCVFDQLSLETLTKIGEKQLNELKDRFNENEISLRISRTVAPALAKRADKKFGARDIRRLIEEHIEFPIAEQLLSQKTHAGSTFSVTAPKEKGILVKGG